MLHLKTAIESSERADITDRLTGKFYTPHNLAFAMPKSAAKDFRPETICDPFCGDGRLVIAWIKHLDQISALEHLKKVSLWDLDEEAVKAARDQITKELENREAGWVEVETIVGDAFKAELDNQFELVVTNPPWEQLKPDSRDRVSKSIQYREEIQHYSMLVAERFPGAASCRKRSIGGYTVNLARAGALLAAKLLKPSGILQIILPSTILGDQVSTEFRNDFFSMIDTHELNFYPAEAKLFAGVDQSVAAVTAKAGRATRGFKIRRFNSDLSVSDERMYRMISAEEPLPLLVGGEQHQIIERLLKVHPPASWLEVDLRFGLRLGRELDETRISEFFAENGLGVPFLKGRNIERFSAKLEDLPLIDPEKKRIPRSTDERRVVWRDVSRPSQKRRIHACLIPEGIVTGNSLGVARFTSPSPHLLETWLAVLNSLVFEAQVRATLATNHVSQGAIKRCSVPYEIFEDEALRAFFARHSKHPQSDSEVQMEIAVAKAYKLDRSEFEILLHTFDKLTSSERDSLLSKEAWA